MGETWTTHIVRWQWVSRTANLLLAIAFAAVLGQSIFSRSPVYPVVVLPAVLQIPSPVRQINGQPVSGPSFTNPSSGFTNPQQLYAFNTTTCFMPSYNDLYKGTYLTTLYIDSENHLTNTELKTDRYVGIETNIFAIQIVIIFFELLMAWMLKWTVDVGLVEPPIINPTAGQKPTKVALTDRLSIYSALTKDLGFNPFRKIMVIVAEVIYTFAAASASGIRNELDLIALSLLVVGWNLCFMSSHTYSVFSLRQLQLPNTEQYKPHFKRQLYYQLAIGFVLEGLWAAVLIASAMNFDIDLNSNSRMFGAWTANISPSLTAFIFAPAVVLLGLHFIFVFGVYSLWWLQESRNARDTTGKYEKKPENVAAEWTRTLLMLDNLDAWKFAAFNIVLFTSVEYWAQSSFNENLAFTCAG